MRHVAIRAIGRIGRTILHALAGAFVVLLIAGVIYLDGRPDVRVWHTADLDEEFTASAGLNDFSEYLALEDRLFEQLQELVYGRTRAEDQSRINRFTHGSLSDPTSWSPNWNRSFELASERPRSGALLLHGLSDSPYSLRGLGERLHAGGAYVVGLRVPGHGTAPSGLVRVKWQDMVAAVRLAMQHLRKQLGDKPIHLVGYSNGGALAVHHALAALEDPTLPKAERLVLISPEIGITPLAAFAVWQGRLGWLAGLEKLAWNSIDPEYDPYKYNSFAVNAGDQAYRLTGENRSRLDALGRAGRLDRFPRVLAFQSAVDATVSPKALVTELFDLLPSQGHELVLFDLNRRAEVDFLLRSDPIEQIRALAADADRPFTLSLVTNENDETAKTVLRTWRAGETRERQSALRFSWPEHVYSLAHVALPFAEDDPIYGREPPADDAKIQLGDLALRGENGVLRVSAQAMLRLRWNPFYAYLEEQALAFLETDRGQSDAAP